MFLCRVLCPLNVQGMAEQDIKMNSFAQATDAAYIYAEAANGSQVKIKKSDLFTSVFAYKGLLSSDKDLNTISENGIYYSAFAMNSPENVSGLLLHYAEKDMASQILINSRNGGLYTRSRVYNTGNWDKWTEWKSITLT
jgi:hypothetical protein